MIVSLGQVSDQFRRWYIGMSPISRVHAVVPFLYPFTKTRIPGMHMISTVTNER